MYRFHTEWHPERWFRAIARRPHDGIETILIQMLETNETPDYTLCLLNAVEKCAIHIPVSCTPRLRALVVERARSLPNMSMWYEDELPMVLDSMHCPK